MIEAVDYHTAGEPFRIVRPQASESRGETPRTPNVRRLLPPDPTGVTDVRIDADG